jgi:hypothetical protein
VGESLGKSGFVDGEPHGARSQKVTISAAKVSLGRSASAPVRP